MDLNSVLTHARHRKSERTQWEAKWDAIAELMRPLRDEFREASTGGGEPRGQRAYDGTGLLALDQAGSTIYSMLTATDNIWAPLEFEQDWRKRDRAARAWIGEVNRILFASLDPSRSGFYNDAPETILDSIGFGTGVFFSQRPAGADFFVDKALPLAECCFEVDPFGAVSHMDRWYRETLFNLARLFGEEQLPKAMQSDLERAPGRKVKVLHSVYPNDDRKRVARGKRFVSHYLLPEDNRGLSVGGFDEMPFFVSRWGVASGETYGRGRGEMALADSQVLNEMNRSTLVAAQKRAEPPIGTHDEIGNLVDLDPNGLNMGAIDDQGRQRIQPLALTGDTGLSLEMMDQRRAAIKDIFYHAMLSLVGSPTPSVVEILKNDERRDQSMGPNLARIMSEFLGPFIEYRFRQLVRAGQIPPPPPAAESANMRVRFVSPLAKAHKAQKAQAVLNTVQGIAQVTALDPRARHTLNGIRAARHVADGFAGPEDILNTDEELAAALEQENQMQQAQLALQAAEQGGRAAASLAQAQAQGEGQ